MKSKQLRQEEGAARQAAHDELTVQQKIDKCRSRRGQSLRETTKLLLLQRSKS